MNARLYRRGARPGMVLLFCLIVTLAVQQRQVQLQTEQFLPYGRYTSAQILEQTQPLLKNLFPDNQEISMLPSRTAGGANPRWNVACKDATGTEIACFIWDASTGWVIHWQTRALHPALEIDRHSGQLLMYGRHIAAPP